jgi:hypothetical protein
MRLNTKPESKIGLLETGIIGYYSRRPIVDFAGLIEPRVSQEFAPDTTYEDSAKWVIENFNLDYLILHKSLYPGLEAGFVEENCILVQNFIGLRYNYPLDVDIFECRN